MVLRVKYVLAVSNSAPSNTCHQPAAGHCIISDLCVLYHATTALNFAIGFSASYCLATPTFIPFETQFIAFLSSCIHEIVRAKSVKHQFRSVQALDWDTY